MKQHLTNSLVKQLIQDQSTGRVSVSDLKVKGLAVDIRSSGATFYFRLTLNGRTRRHTLGQFGAIDVATARRFAIEKTNQFASVAHQGDQQETADICFDAYFEQHFLPWCKVYRKTYSSHQSLYKNHLKKRFGHMILRDLSNKYLLGLVQDLAEAGYSKSFIN